MPLKIPDEEYVFLIKDCVRINQFEKFTTNELGYVYNKGSELLKSRPDDIDLLQAIIVFKSKIHERSESKYDSVSSKEIPDRKKRGVSGIIAALIFILMISGLVFDCSKRSFRALDAFFYDVDR